MYIIYNIII